MKKCLDAFKYVARKCLGNNKNPKYKKIVRNTEAN